jgi:hypothetical protein
MAADGAFVIVWEGEQDFFGYGVYAQRYGAAGAPVGGEFAVAPFTHSQRNPSAAMGANGDFVVAWTHGADGFQEGIRAKRFSAAGGATNDFSVNALTQNRQAFPAADMDADGDFVITWLSQQQDGSGYDVYARRYSPAGASNPVEFRVSPIGGDHGGRAVGMDADGDFVVAWNTLNNNDVDVYAQRYAPNEQPTATGIPAVAVQQDAADTVIDLFAAFADSTDPDALLAYSVVGNTNPTLFSGTPITAGPAAATLALDYAPGRTGTAALTVRATDTGGLFVDTVLNVTVTPAMLVVTGTEFVYQTPPHRLRVTFNRPIDAGSLEPSDLTFQALMSPTPVVLPATAVTYDPATRTATFTLPPAGQQFLADGNYRATLTAGAVNDPSGAALAAASVADFFVLTGDINRDRSVNGTDFAILAGNFGRTGVSYSQGDLNGDNAVNGSDFALLAGNFGRTVPPPAPAVVAAARTAPPAEARRAVAFPPALPAVAKARKQGRRRRQV